MSATAKTRNHYGSTSRDLRLREGASDDNDRWLRDRGGYEGRRTSDLSAMATDRDLTTVELFKARRSSRRNYKSSGIFGAMVDQAVCHVVGDGVSIRFKDPKVGEYVLGVLNHPRNAFLDGLDETFRRWVVDGEQVVTMRSTLRSDAGNPTGDVWLGLKDPNEISGFTTDTWNDQRITELRLPTPKPPENVAASDAHPQTAWIPVGEPDPDKGDELPKGWPIPRYDAAGKPIKPGLGSSQLHVLYLRMNALGARGVPLFARSVDKVTMLDLLVDHLMAKAEYTNRHWVHITYKQKDNGGRSDKAFEKKMLKWATDAQPGEAACTSDDVKVEVLAPKLEMVDQKALYEIGVGYILGSHSMPRVWFGESAGERSGAAEAGSPIHRLLKWLQARLRGGVEALVRFLVAIGKKATKFPAGADCSFTVTMAEFATRDSVRDMQELTWGTQALDGALASGAITREEHQKMVRKLIAGKPIGSELDDDPPPLPETPEAGHAGDLPLHGAPGVNPDGGEVRPTEKPGAQGSPTPAPAGSAPPAPAAPVTPGGAAPVPVQATALNGAQIAAVVDVCAQVTAGSLSGDAARAILALAFPGYDLEMIGSAIEAAELEGEKQKAADKLNAERMAKMGAVHGAPPQTPNPDEGNPPPPPKA